MQCCTDSTILESKPQTTVFQLIDNITWCTLDIFEQGLLPFIDAVFFWKLNKDLGLTTAEFTKMVSEKISSGDASAFYGHLSEVYLSGLYIFDGWHPEYIENLKQQKARKQIEWIFTKGYKVGVECKDKRQQMQENKLVKLIDVEAMVIDAIEKFSTPETKRYDLQKRILWINVTDIIDYSEPSLEELGKITSRPSGHPCAGILKPSFSLSDKTEEIDGIVITWRQKKSCDNAFEYRQRYVVTENIDFDVDLPKYQPAIRIIPGKCFFIRKFGHPEQQFIFSAEEAVH